MQVRTTLASGMLLLAACAFERPSDVGRLGGSVSGLWVGSEPVGLQLSAPGVDESVDISVDGDFRLTSLLPRGTSYEVAITRQPLLHDCIFRDSGVGVIGDELPLLIACVGPATLSLAPPYAVSLDGSLSNPSVALSELARSVELTVESELPSVSISVNGVPRVFGAPVAVDLPASGLTLTVLLAAAGMQRSIEVAIGSGGGAINPEPPLARAGSYTFGASLAADDHTLIVGDPGSPGSGAAYAYERELVDWTLRSGLVPDMPPIDGRFGTAVAVSGTTAVVGAPGASGGSGAVYVFRRVTSTWDDVAVVTGDIALEQFGASVALDGSRLVVGAPGAPGALGTAYVFEATGSTWTRVATLSAVGWGLGDEFGAAVALQGSRIVVGAPGEDGGAGGVQGDSSAADEGSPGSGAAYVFEPFNNFWVERAYIKPTIVDAQDRFGAVLVLAENQLAISAPREDGGSIEPNDDSAIDAGAAYVFSRLGETWRQIVYAKSSSPLAGAGFGESMAFDGRSLVIGAPGDGRCGTVPPDCTRGGAVYVLDAAALRERAVLREIAEIADDQVGSATALCKNSLFVGAPGTGGGRVLRYR